MGESTAPTGQLGGSLGEALDRLHDLVEPFLLAADDEHLHREDPGGGLVVAFVAVGQRIVCELLAVLELPDDVSVVGANRRCKPHKITFASRFGQAPQRLQLALDRFDVSELEQEVEQPCVRQRLQSAVADLAGHTFELSGHGQGLVQAVGAAGGPQGAGEHVRERRLVGDPPGHLQRLTTEHRLAVLKIGVGERGGHQLRT